LVPPRPPAPPPSALAGELPRYEIVNVDMTATAPVTGIDKGSTVPTRAVPASNEALMARNEFWREKAETV
jgi:hypothetical protein